MIELDIRSEVLKALEEKKVVLGMKRSIEGIKLNTLSKVIYAKNTPSDIKEDILYYSKMNGIEAVEFPGNNMELGVLCGRPHSVMVLGILK